MRNSKLRRARARTQAQARPCAGARKRWLSWGLLCGEPNAGRRWSTWRAAIEGIGRDCERRGRPVGQKLSPGDQNRRRSRSEACASGAPGRLSFAFAGAPAGETIVASPALAQPARERAAKGQRRRAPERDLRRMRRRAPERDRRQRRSERLADQPAGGLQARGAPASLARRAADDHPVVGRLENPEAEAADRKPPGERSGMDMADAKSD